MKFSAYLHEGKKTLITSGMTQGKKTLMTSGMTLTSKPLIRNPQHPPSTPFLTPLPDTLNYDINMKFSAYLHEGKKTSLMTSGMNLSSKSLIMNPQCPPSTHFLTRLPDTLLLKISIQNIQGIFLRAKTIIHDIKDDPVI